MNSRGGSSSCEGGVKVFFWPVRSQNALEGVSEGAELISDEGRTINLTPGADQAHVMRGERFVLACSQPNGSLGFSRVRNSFLMKSEPKTEFEGSNAAAEHACQLSSEHTPPASGAAPARSVAKTALLTAFFSESATKCNDWRYAPERAEAAL